MLSFSVTTFLWILITIPLSSVTAAEYINVHQFSLLFTNYLVFDHIDGSLNILSNHISHHFQDRIIIDHDDRVLDMDLLKGQLQAAIHSFVEDSLPTIWNTRSTTVLDKTYLMEYIEKVTHQYCHSNELQCVENHSNEILKEVSLHIQYQLNTLLKNVIEHDLSTLFQVTQQHVNSILNHFNRQYSISSFSSIDLSTLHAHLDLKLNLYLQSIQDQSHLSLKKFSSLCKQ